ncbi:MAG: hypothetical protein M1839_001178 [Geoglossum umbratile]|nr:MAG: hypothetical protein M1839_001178 [Geoglossum umbratile]
MTRAGRDCLFQVVAALLLLLGACPAAGAAASALPPSPSLTALPTCQSRTVNYIIHTLPQQCLKAGWVGVAGPAAEEGTGIECYGAITGVTGRNTHPDLYPTGQGRETAVVATLTSASTTTAPVELPLAASSQASLPAPADQDIDRETEALLEEANFLSFGEWKKQNLERIGQSGENIGDRRQGHKEHRRRPGIDNVLDSLGEDSEIELDFGGFVPRESGTDEPSPWSPPTTSGDGRVAKPNAPEGEDGVRGTIRSRPKDAGKTYAERFNYASFDCAATVLKTNPECKASSSILVENKDSYMLNECAAKTKFFIVELCNDILVDTVVLANFEFFSSMFRSFRVSVSDRYPTTTPDRWKELGVFEARNSRGVQAFLVQNSLIWARYLRIEFLTHYGNEFYCPVSLLRVHGTTMMEEFRREEDARRGEEESAHEVELEAESSVRDVIAAENATPNVQDTASGGAHEPLDQRASEQPGPTPKEVENRPGGPATVSTDESDVSLYDPQFIAELEELFSPFNISGYLVCNLDEDTGKGQPEPHHQTDIKPAPSNEDTSAALPSPTAAQEPAPALGKPAQAPKASNTTKDATPQTTAEVSTKLSDSTSQDGRQPQAPATGPPPANPKTQESFFKTIHKRLQLLEANATLSLQYIEEQSRILRDAFVKIEKRQLTKTTNFLENLNTTVLNELKSFRQMYDLLWQSTVIELETQREQSQREILAISARLSILADEVIFQKRMSIVQSIILLLCLGLVLFSRYPATASYLELPLLQSMLARSHTTLSSPYESPPSSPRRALSRPLSAGQGSEKPHFGHSRRPSDESTSSPRSTPEFSPATPSSGTTYGRDSDGIGGRRRRAASSPRPESAEGPGGTIQSSPSIPGWTRDPSGVRNPITWRGPKRREGLLSPERTPERDTTRKLSPLRRQETQEEGETSEDEEMDGDQQDEGDDDQYDDTRTENEYIRPQLLSPPPEEPPPPPPTRE